MEFHVQRDPYLFGDLKLWLREQVGDDRYVLHTHDNRRVDISPAAAADPDAYFCVIPERAAHSLLAVLSRELGAVEHPEQLRRDFERLRDRHDKLVDHILEVTWSRASRR